MSGGNQQKAIIAREIDATSPLLSRVQPTRGLDVGAIEYSTASSSPSGKEQAYCSSAPEPTVKSLSDRISLLCVRGQIVGETDLKKITVQELGLTPVLSAQTRRVKRYKENRASSHEGLHAESRRRCCPFLLIGLVVGSLVILIVGLTFSKKAFPWRMGGHPPYLPGISAPGRDATGVLYWGSTPRASATCSSARPCSL